MYNELSNLVVEQTACPKCPSSDAFTIYDDGHCKCYSCGHFVPAGRVVRINEAKPKDKYEVRLPRDSNTDLPAFALEWLNKYDITLQEAREHKFKWSEEKQLLLFPIYGHDSTLIFWQGRYFGTEKKSKYDSRGKKEDIIHIISPKEQDVERTYDEVILTEDLLSAIKVGRQQAAMPIWGSYISIDQFKRLFLGFDRVGIWLDSDKFKEVIKYASIGSQIGLTRLLYTELDPKCLSDDQIKQILGDSSYGY